MLGAYGIVIEANCVEVAGTAKRTFTCLARSRLVGWARGECCACNGAAILFRKVHRSSDSRFVRVRWRFRRVSIEVGESLGSTDMSSEETAVPAFK